MTIYGAPQVTGQYRAYRDAVYLNGALFLEELRAMMGDTAFFAALNDYQTRYKYKLGNTPSFFKIICQDLEEDAEGLFGKYFLTPTICK